MTEVGGTTSTPTSASGGTDASGESGDATAPTSAATTDGPAVCDGGEPEIGDAVETSFYYGVAAGMSLAEGSCYSGSGPETFVNFRPVEAGPYSLRINNPAFTPRLAIYEGLNACSGTELACLAEGTVNGKVVHYQSFGAGTELTIVVDTASPGEFGDFELEIVRGIYLYCSFNDDYSDELPPFSIYGDLATTGYWADTSCGSCGGENFRDTQMTWTAAADGSYRFTLMADFDPILYVSNNETDGSFSCSTELACADDAGPGAPEVVTLDLTAGQNVRMFVDGKGEMYGPFELQIEQL
ncbi:hypothetical protein [Nannocystis sp.]|uniref:hypothetical protein n=1 Tax=Nannocystis sp. TaxID=1962667 RepID=UPI0025D0F513|nr:hypothetical protein [Nannocystis sp.]MBK7827967.1 hypothetical protein [Nannocystis sp.]